MTGSPLSATASPFLVSGRRTGVISPNSDDSKRLVLPPACDILFPSGDDMGEASNELVTFPAFAHSTPGSVCGAMRMYVIVC